MITASDARLTATNVLTGYTWLNNLVTGNSANGYYSVIVEDQRMNDTIAQSLRDNQGYEVAIQTFDSSVFSRYVINWAPSPSPSPTPQPSSTPSVTPSISISVTPSISISVTPSISISVTPSHTPSVTPSISGTPAVTPSISVTPSHTPSVTPSHTPSVTPSITPSASVMPNLIVVNNGTYSINDVRLSGITVSQLSYPILSGTTQSVYAPAYNDVTAQVNLASVSTNECIIIGGAKQTTIGNDTYSEDHMGTLTPLTITYQTGVCV